MDEKTAERLQELLEGFLPGDSVQAIYGTKDKLITYSGTIEKISSNFLTLRTNDPRPVKVPLDELFRTLTPCEDGGKTRYPDDEPHQSSQMIEKPVVVCQNHRQLAPLAPAKPYRFDIQEWISTLRAMTKQSGNVHFKQSVHGILDSLHDAIKATALAYKYHDLRFRLLQLWNTCNCSQDYEVFYLALGVLSIEAKDYSYSLEPLVRAKKYTLAAYAASMGQYSQDAEIYTICAVLNRESGAVINQYTSEICINRQDPEILAVLLEQNQEDPQICEYIASSAYAMYQESKGRLSADITPYFSASQAARALLEAVPADWKKDSLIKKRWDEFSQYAYPVSEFDEIKNLPASFTGKIVRFESGDGKNWGFISRDGTLSSGKDDFFHIAQVNDFTESGLLLRKVLALGVAKGLEVRYTLGRSSRDYYEAVANNVSLTEKGLLQAKKLLESGGLDSPVRKGFIDSYKIDREIGIILSAGARYNFRLNDIVDPYLRVYYQEAFNPKEQNVTFEIAGKQAYNICWNEPKKKDLEAYAGIVTAQQKEEWQAFLNDQANNRKTMDLPKDDPFSGYQFFTLEKWTPPMQEKGKPLTWEKVENMPNTNKTVTTPSEPVQIVVEKPQSPDARVYAERARRYTSEGKYAEAEAAFENALKYGGFNDRVVSDYVTLFMTQPEKTERAAQLLDRFASKFPPEKLLNHRIQVYDKMKNYQKLSPLYEEAVNASASISRRSHYLIRLIEAYIKSGSYNKALDTCLRWEAFYSQNRYSSDAEKMKRAAPNVERQKAICYYHTGKIDEARQIATNLIRSNPADEAANKILSGTLTMNTILSMEGVDSLMDDDDPFADDEVHAEDTQMSRFVRSKIQQAEIVSNIRSTKLKDGKFVGTVEEAAEEIRRQLRGRRTFASSRARSDMLFAACKLLDQTEQQSNAESRGKNYKYRLAGRAMASWGDYMVSQSMQLDTPRMAYLSTLKLLMPSSKGMEQDWQNALNRYLRSFFMARVGNDSLDTYINHQQSTGARDALNTNIFTEKTIPEVLIPEFFVGILKLLDAMQKYPLHQKNITEDLYSKNPALRDALCIQLENFLGEQLEQNVSKATFIKQMHRAGEKRKNNLDDLNEVMVDMASQLMLRKVPMEMVDKLNPNLWKDSITATDARRLGNIVYVIKRSQDYYESNDFENRAGCLRAAILALKDLQQVIQREPTDVSYDVFLPALDQMAMKLSDTEISLYQNFQPKLSWSEVIQPFKTGDNKVQIQLSVENEINYQAADALRIESVRSPEIINYDKDKVTVIETLRGGENQEISLVVALDEAALQAGSFSAVINCTYTCNETPENVIIRSQEQVFSFVIFNQDVKELVNPFDKFIGKTMSDVDMFYGREDQIRRIVDTVYTTDTDTMNYGRAIAMYGQTRTGKSSVMYHLKNRIQKDLGDRVLIWDMGNLGKMKIEETTEFMAFFLRNMLFRGKKAIRNNLRISEKVEALGITPPLNEILAQPKNADVFFNEYMTELDNILRQEQVIIVLMIDEFTYIHEKITDGILSTDFMRFWKALLQDYSIFAIIAGQDDTPQFIQDYPNEFACMELLKLTYLGESATKQLIQEPVERKNGRSNLFRNDGCVDVLYELTAGSPYLSVLLCSQLIQYLNSKGAYMVTKGIVEDFLRTKVLSPDTFLEEANFEAQLQERGRRDLDDVNYEILLSVARLSQTTGYACLDDIECEGKSRDEIRDLVERLEKRNVLIREGRDNYYIHVRLLERWLIQKNGV